MAKRPNSKVVDLGPSVWLAAFGKHPGWNDHIDDLGIETDRLVAVKRTLYVDGIRKIIDGGMWDALKPEQFMEGFGHSFLWRSYDGLVVGRMWSSTDGKGRGRYPMIVCCQMHGVSLDTVGRRVLPRLKQLEADCVSVGNAPGVIGLVDAARQELASLASGAPRVTPDPLPPPAAISVLGEDWPRGVGREGVTRVLYQIEREFAAFVTPDASSGASGKSRSQDVRSQQMRVPALRGTEEDIWGLWGNALFTRLDPLTSMLLISRDGRDWLDIIVGEPGPAQLVCLQASTHGVPLTTDIPYVIDDAFVEGVGKVLDAGAKGEIADRDLGYVAASSERIAAMSRGLSRRNAEEEETPQSKAPLLVAAGGVALIVIVVIAFLMGRGDGKSSGATPDTANEPAPEHPRHASQTDQQDNQIGGASTDSGAARGAVPNAVPPVDAEVADAFARWCDEADSWFLGFRASLGAQASLSPYLTERVVGPIRRAEDDGVQLDPREWVDNAPPSRRRLAELAHSDMPPPELKAPGAIEEISRALAVIDATRLAISPGAWDSAGAIEQAADACQQAGLPQQASTLRGVLAGLGSSSDALVVEAVHKVDDAGQPATRFTRSLDAIRDAMPVISGAEDKVLRSFPAFAQRHVQNAMQAITGPRDLAEAADRLEPLASLATDLANAVETRLPTVDAEVFRATSQVHKGFGAGAETIAATYEAWLAQVGLPAFQQIDPALDPRTRPELTQLRARIESETELLRSMLPPSAAASLSRVETTLGELTRSYDALQEAPWNRTNAERLEQQAGVWGSSASTLLSRIAGLRQDAIAGASDRIREMESRDTVSTRGFTRIDEAWQTRRDQVIAAYEADQDVEALHNRAIDLEKFFVDLESGVATSEPTPGPGINAEALATALKTKRAEIIAKAIGSAHWDRVAYTNADTVVRDAANASASYTGTLSDLVERAGRIDRLLSEGYLLDEPAGPDRLSLRERSQLLAQDASTLGEGVDGIASPVLSAVDRLVAISGESDRAILRSDARESGGYLALSVGAWDRLGRLTDTPWPATPAELRQEREIEQRLGQRIQAELPQERADKLAQSLASETTRRWHVLAANAADAETWRELARRAADLDLSPASLSPSERFSLALAELDAASPGPDEQTLRASAQAAYADLQSASGELPGSADRGAWLSSLAGLLQDKPEQAPPLDPGSLGPARAGWSVQEYSEDRIVYAWDGPGGPLTLAFRLVEQEGAEPVFLCETELQASALAIAIHTTDGPILRELLPEPWPRGRDPRRGPRTWEWGGTGLDREPVIAREWIADSPGKLDPYYPNRIEASVGQPTGAHPLNRVSSAAAVMIAKSLGCRLPSQKEWKAAYIQAGSPGVGADANLRDQTWAAQRAHVQAMAQGNLLPDWPDVEIATPSRYRTGEDPVAQSFTDGILWFEPVAKGADGFQGLVGNVAEWLAEYSPGTEQFRGDIDGASASPSPEQVVQAASPGDGVLGMSIVGGSALSPVSVEVDLPFGQPGRRLNTLGYTDVGLRLAFSVRGQSVERSFQSRLAELLREAPYLRGVGG